eukprot:2928836-Amphidinium_carterae.1
MMQCRSTSSWTSFWHTSVELDGGAFVSHVETAITMPGTQGVPLCWHYGLAHHTSVTVWEDS